MRILVSNDDGIHAKGISVLADALKKIADVTIIAPDRNCSGASNSLTLINPIRVHALSRDCYSVNGTPTDCVHVGINQLMSEQVPDLVISGINHGANLADDVMYSGTVAAAMEGRHMGMPAIAVSLVGTEHFETAAQVVCAIVPKLKDLNLSANQILNINVPDVPYDQLNGIKITRCGQRHQAETMTRTTDPYGRDIYWYGPQGEASDNSEDTDFYAINNQYVSLCPLTVDMTAYQSLGELNNWLKNVL